MSSRLIPLLRRPMILVSVGVGLLLVSFSFCARVIRQETGKVKRLERSLQEIRGFRNQVERPLAGYPLLSDTGIVSPLQGLAPEWVTFLEASGQPRRRTLGAGLDRITLDLSFRNLPPEQLGNLLGSLEGAERGWWVTEVSLGSGDSVLEGTLKVEALDHSNANDPQGTSK